MILNLVSNAHEALRGARRGGAIMIAGVVAENRPGGGAVFRLAFPVATS